MKKKTIIIIVSVVVLLGLMSGVGINARCWNYSFLFCIIGVFYFLAYGFFLYVAYRFVKLLFKMLGKGLTDITYESEKIRERARQDYKKKKV